MLRLLDLLIIDDVEDDAALVVRAIKSAGFEVRHRRVQDRSAVIEAFRAQRYDAVVCDFNLPSYDAYHAIEDIRAIAGDIPIVIVSGSIGEERAVELIKRGANDYVPKQHLGRVPTALERELDRHRTERAQKDAEAQALLSDRMASVGTLAAGVAHEINNPLAAVNANIAFAMRELEKAKAVLANVQEMDLAETFAALADAREASDRVRDIVRDLKLFSRDKGEEVVGPVDLTAVVESSLRMARNEIRHRARVVNEVTSTPPVLGSESRIGQVVLNMLVNAAQAIPDGRAHENEIRIATRTEGDWVVLEISDTGVGMSEEIRARIFTPFFTTKPVGVGTGLGLSICYRIVTDLGGRIDVASQLGKGTTFTIRFPTAADAAVGEAEVAEPPAAAATPRKRILVVDDEALVGRTVQRALGSRHEVVTSLSAREALALVGRERFDLILCDMMMPEMNGMEFYGELASVRPEAAGNVVFVTGGAFTDRARQFLEAPGRRRLEKPFDLKALLGLVER